MVNRHAAENDLGITRSSLSTVADDLASVRAALRARCGRAADAGRRDNIIDFLIDTAFAPLALLAGSGGFEDLDEAVEVIGDDLAEAIAEIQAKGIHAGGAV